MSSRGRAAGDSSERKYKGLVRSWRRRNRKLFVTLGLICWGLLVATFVAAQHWQSQAWILGFFGGAAITLWLIARLSPPGWIENWQSGAWGEQATAKVLRALEGNGWIVLHDLPAGREAVKNSV